MFNPDGLIIGLSAFLIIGIFHPIVIKTEYYFGTRPWWIFLVFGIGGIIGSLFIGNTLLSILTGILAFCCLWSILELFEQKTRVEKGWFPKNPKRTYKDRTETKEGK